MFFVENASIIITDGISYYKKIEMSNLKKRKKRVIA